MAMWSMTACNQKSGQPSSSNDERPIERDMKEGQHGNSQSSKEVTRSIVKW